MRSTLHSPVPSSTLLKFLKSQSEGVYFFNPNLRPGFIFDHAAPRATQAGTRSTKAYLKSSARCLTTTSPVCATVEAGFGHLDFLWPRSTTLALRPQPRNTPRAKTSSHDNSLVTQRNASTRTRWNQWRNRLWGASAKKGGKPLQPDDLPMPFEDSSDSAFRMGYRISAKAAAQPKLRCTELDENGNVVLASGEFKKSELIAKVIQARV